MKRILQFVVSLTVDEEADAEELRTMIQEGCNHHPDLCDVGFVSVQKVVDRD